MPGVRVQTTDALKAAKAAIAEFAELANATLVGVEADVQRMGQWLTHDRPSHWKHEVRRREEIVQACKQEISRKRLIRAPEPASVVLEQKALRRAEQRLDAARRKLDNVHKWAGTWERESMVYKGACRGLSDSIAADLPAAKARLDRMIENIDAYVRIAPPTDGSGPATATDPSETQG